MRYLRSLVVLALSTLCATLAVADEYSDAAWDTRIYPHLQREISTGVDLLSIGAQIIGDNRGKRRIGLNAVDEGPFTKLIGLDSGSTTARNTRSAPTRPGRCGSTR